MKYKKNIIFALILIIITILFFTYQVVITYDTSHYLWLTSLFTQEGEFSDWDVARGPVFPMFIRICNILFGQNINGLLIGMFIFYILLLVTCYLIYKDTIKDEEILSKKMKYLLLFLFSVLVVFNPMIIGYYHTLLTEFIAITLAVIGCYLAWKWIDVDFLENKIKYIIYTSVLAILTAIAWQLKQPYVSTILFPIITAIIISCIRNRKIVNFVQRFITFCVCIIVLFSSIKIWDFILKNGNVNIKEDRTSGGFLASGILNGTKEYDNINIENFDTIEEIKNNEKINEDDKQKMIDVLEERSEYKSFNILAKNDEYKIIYNKGTNISTMEAVKFLVDSFIKDPILIIKNYAANYLATISVYDIEFEGMKIIVNRKINFINTEEIEAIGFRIYEYGLGNVFPLSEEYEIYSQPYKDTNKPVVALNWIMKQLKLPNVLAMKIAFLILPILTIISIILLFLIKNKYNKKYNRLVDMIIILFVYSFIHILVHAILGSTIDRYTIPALSTTIIGILLSIYVIVYRGKYKIDHKIKQSDKGENNRK